MVDKQQVLMTAEELEAEVDRRLDEEMARKRQAIRLEVAEMVRREEFRKRMDKINARGPEWDAPSPSQQAAMDAAMDARRREHFERLDKRRAEIDAANAAAETALRKHFAASKR
jgi:acetylornithine deacetylase/succinyl-diaminopimelate desuccinylase-like protein